MSIIVNEELSSHSPSIRVHNLWTGMQPTGGFSHRDEPVSRTRLVTSIPTVVDQHQDQP